MFELSLQLSSDLSEEHVVQILEVLALHHIDYLHQIVLNCSSL